MKYCNKFKFLLVVFILSTLSSLINAAVVTVNEGYLRYTVNTSTGTAWVEGLSTDYFSKTITNLVIPDFIEYNGIQIPVTSILSHVFYGKSDLKGSLTIGENVQTIGEWAFYGCSSFTGSLTIPNSVQTIGKNAFYNCTGFNGPLTIGDNVQTIGDGAFQKCSGFTGSLTIGENVQTIGNYAFRDCSGFTGSLTIPNSVEIIGEYAFYRCSGFTGSLTIGDNVQTIGEWAFYYCNGFTGSLTIPNSVQTIGDYAFEYCNGFTGSLTIGDNVQTIGASAFEYCKGFSGSLTLGENVQTISGYAFAYCKGITGSLTIPHSVQTIGSMAFCDCKFNEVKSLAENPASAGSSAFYNFYKSPLYVPTESVNLYKSAKEWKEFTNINPIPIEATGIKLNKTELSLVVGQEEKLIATLTPEDATTKIVWSIEEGNDVISIDQTGKVTALAVGNATVKATAGEVSATCKVNVDPVLASSVTLNVQNLTLLVGQTDKLNATVTPENTTDKTISWSSDSETIAKVNTDGTVTTLATGVATITATCGDATATCKVTVKGADDVTVKPGDGTTPGDDNDTPGNNTENGGSLIGNDLTLRVNQSATIDLVIQESLSVEPKFDWTLDNGSAEFVSMTVKENTLSATFKGLKVGQTGYTVSIVGVNGNIEAVKGKITVIAETPMKSLRLDPASISMAKNALPQTIKTVYTPDNATMAEFSWTSSAPKVATVEDNGVVTPVAMGTATITCAALDGSGLSAICEVTVTEPIDDNFEFDFDESVMGGKEGISLYIGDTYQFKPKAQDGYVLPDVINWSSSDNQKVSVTDEGLVTALALGKATLTASATVNDKEVKATCEVTVIPILATSISIDGEDIHTLKQTETLQLTATVIPENTTYQEITWRSSDESKATVSTSGLVTAIEEGNVEITAVLTYQQEISASYTISIQKRLLGDANDNGVVNVADVGTISDYIVKKPVYNFCFVNADVITDGKITTADVTATVDIIFNDTPSITKFAKARKISGVGNNELIIDNFNSPASSIVGINLKNPSEFTGLQGSIIIPEGVTVSNVTKGSGASNHILNFNVMDRGTVEFILYSLQNATFDSMGSLIELEIQAGINSDDIIVENILASDSAANEYSISFTGGKNNDLITSLNSVDNDKIKIYSVSEGIVILNAQDEYVNVFNVAGERIIYTKVGSNKEFYPLTNGIYIVTVKTETAKIIVK